MLGLWFGKTITDLKPVLNKRLPVYGKNGFNNPSQNQANLLRFGRSMIQSPCCQPLHRHSHHPSHTCSCNALKFTLHGNFTKHRKQRYESCTHLFKTVSIFFSATPSNTTWDRCLHRMHRSRSGQLKEMDINGNKHFQTPSYQYMKQIHVCSIYDLKP